MHLDHVLSCRVMAEERRRVLARALHEPGWLVRERERGIAEATVIVAAEHARFVGAATALGARLDAARLFDSDELRALRATVAAAAAAIDAAAAATLRLARGDDADLAPVRR